MRGFTRERQQSEPSNSQADGVRPTGLSHSLATAAVRTVIPTCVRVAQLEIVMVIAAPWAKQHHLCGIWFNQEALHQKAELIAASRLYPKGLFHASVIDFVGLCVFWLSPSATPTDKM